MMKLWMVGLFVLSCAACGASDHKASATAVPVPVYEADNAKLVASIDTSMVFGTQAEPMCSTSSDCTFGTCTSGKCGGCSTSSDCKGNGTCSSGTCGHCSTSSDCSVGTCSSGTCGHCSTSSDCHGGTCNSGKCDNAGA